ncbi:Mu transposase C-terminal domain-containing protein [Paralysiella testudinis]|uniref:Mu transposase C-terminal domain-containing protein n=2 Tax=Paralysiella testudinis TaxID=2809020 RepID=A0A892ZJV8_9NEIS|nr:Mu transposase C-terminal domain-containing protein [Paralysiella testudinis]QRQ81834.1 Mu transposase C-terminal domain-containing protein [Paralysiella testudinis]
MKTHYSVAELVALELTCLPKTKVGIGDKVKRESWPFIEVDGKGGKGGKRREHMTPNEIWALKISEGAKTVPVLPEEKHMLFMPQVLCTVERGRVRFANNHYFSKALQEYHGDLVRVAYDIHNAETVWIYDDCGRPVCTAEWNGNNTDYMPVSVREQAKEKRVDAQLKRLGKKADTVEAARPVRYIEQQDTRLNLGGMVLDMADLKTQAKASMAVLQAAETPKAAEVAVGGYEYFVSTYFPHYIRSAEKSELHRYLFKRLPEVLRAPEGCPEAIGAPRGEGKSTQVTQLFTLYCIVTGQKHYCVIVMDSIDQAYPMLEAIKAELEFNPRFKTDFPDAAGQGRVWQAGTIVTANDIKVQVAGSGKKLRGLRHGPYRPDLTVLDDIENDEQVRNPEQRDKTEAWLKKTVLPLGGVGQKYDVVYIGTILHYDSVLSRTLKNPFWRSIKFKAMLQWPDNMVLWEKWEELYRNDGESVADAFYQAHKIEMKQGAHTSWAARDVLALMKIRARDGHTTFDSEYQNDPVGALEALFGERHNADALDKMVAAREVWLENRLQMPPTLELTTLPSTAQRNEVARLMSAHGDNLLREHEAIAAAQWEQAFGVRLQPYDGVGNKYGKPDYYITDNKLPKKQWQTLDFMFTADIDDTKSIHNLNRFFAHTTDGWKDKQRRIQLHLLKSDIVPLDLRHLNTENRARLLSYVLSLTKEQQNQIKLIVSESS